MCRQVEAVAGYDHFMKLYRADPKARPLEVSFATPAAQAVPCVGPADGLPGRAQDRVDRLSARLSVRPEAQPEVWRPGAASAPWAQGDSEGLYEVVDFYGTGGPGEGDPGEGGLVEEGLEDIEFGLDEEDEELVLAQAAAAAAKAAAVARAAGHQAAVASPIHKPLAAAAAGAAAGPSGRAAAARGTSRVRARRATGEAPSPGASLLRPKTRGSAAQRGARPSGRRARRRPTSCCGTGQKGAGKLLFGPSTKSSRERTLICGERGRLFKVID